MKFVLDNLYLFVIALASGGMLLWPLLRRGSGSAAVTPLEAVQLINHRNAIVVDVRDESVFAAGSLTGARNVPFASLDARMTELTRFKARPAIVVCENGQQSARAVAALKKAGFEEARALAGGLAAWKQAGLPLVGPTRETKGTAPKGDGKDRAAKANTRNEYRERAKAARTALASPDSAPATESLNGRATLDEAATPIEAAADGEPAPDRAKAAS